MSARARIVTGAVEDAVAVPIEATVERSGRRVAFFVSEGRATAVSLSEAVQDGDRILIGASSISGDLVLRGQRDLRDGMRVRVDNSVLAEASFEGSAGPGS